MKSHFLLFVFTPLVTFVLWPGTLLAQKPIAEESRHYRLIQVVETATLEKLNEGADEGYRLASVVATKSGSIDAIMKKVENGVKP